MQKLTDQEFDSVREGICNLGKLVSAEHPMRSALQKLLANYQEQLEAESYALLESQGHVVGPRCGELTAVDGVWRKLERYTEANCATTELSVEVEP